jgi:hypothetical protein
MLNLKKKLMYVHKDINSDFRPQYDNYPSDNKSIFYAIVEYSFFNTRIPNHEYQILKPHNSIVLGDLEYFYAKF